MREHERQRNDSQRRDQQRRASTAKPGASHGDSGADTTPRGDDVASSSGLVLPGGKVGEDALRRAIEQARELGVGEENEAALRTVRFELTRDLQKRLDKYLTDRIGFLSRTQLQRLIDEGGVRVNGREPKASTKVGLGDVVEVVIPEPPAKNIQPENIPLDVLFEDEHLIVLNKQPDIIVHPARSHLKGTMLSALAYHFQRGGGELSTVGEEFARPGVVHRLDRHTSGCIVFAKKDEAHWKLGHQFEHRRVDKRYIAVVHGRVEPDVQVVELPIGPHPSREKGYREKYVVRHDDLGKHAVTICRVRERYDLRGSGLRGPRLARSKSDDGHDFTLVELELKTGRTHQIRVHLSHLLWPIVGDDMYGGEGLGLLTEPADGAGTPVLFEAGEATPPASVEVVIRRQALHAAVLGFEHPATGGAMRFTAPLRGDISRLVSVLRARSRDGFTTVEAPGATVDLRAMIG